MPSFPITSWPHPQLGPIHEAHPIRRALVDAGVKGQRARIFIPIAIEVAGRFGYSAVSLALPVAFMIEHVYVLPFNSKPAALLYETDRYTLSDAFKLGITVMAIAWVINVIAGETWFRFLGITPNGVFGLF